MGVWIGGLIAKLKLNKSKLNLKLNIIKIKTKVNALITLYWIAFLDVNSIYCERLIDFDCDCRFDSHLT